MNISEAKRVEALMERRLMRQRAEAATWCIHDALDDSYALGQDVLALLEERQEMTEENRALRNALLDLEAIMSRACQEYTAKKSAIAGATSD